MQKRNHVILGAPEREKEYQPPACPKCGSSNTAELGNYLTGKDLTMIRCRDCGYQVTVTGETIPVSQMLARLKWSDPGPDEDVRTGSGLIEEE